MAVALKTNVAGFAASWAAQVDDEVCDSTAKVLAAKVAVPNSSSLQAARVSEVPTPSTSAAARAALAFV